MGNRIATILARLPIGERDPRKRLAQIQAETARLKATWAQPANIPIKNQIDIVGQPIEREYSLYDLLRRPAVTYAALKPWMQAESAAPHSAVAEQVEIAAKYAGYIERQRDEIGRQLSQESLPLPADLDYGRLSGLSNEIKQKFIAVRPVSLGQARRIEGVTPAALALIAAHARKAERSASRSPLPAVT